MKRFGGFAFLVFVLYAVTIFAASYHHHDVNSEHLNCKLCQFGSDSADSTPTAKAISENNPIGFVPEIDVDAVHNEIASLRFGRAPPTTIL